MHVQENIWCCFVFTRQYVSTNPSYYQNSRRDEWYQDAESFYANQRTHFRSMPREAMGYTMSQHYSVLGLDRSRLELFSDAEIKTSQDKKKRMHLGEKRIIQIKTNITKRLLRQNPKRGMGGAIAVSSALGAESS
uniref:Uncharacterized protein n=1 Tax=Oryza punctata TaxID=4537 RepID=A0A0E0LGK9_ORYPU